MGKSEGISQMINFPFVLYNVGFLNFIIQNEIMPLDTGFVLVAENATQARQFVNSYCHAKGSNGVTIERWNTRARDPKPENFKVGMLTLDNSHKQGDIEQFLKEEKFFPVVISSAILPNYLETDYPIFNLKQDDVNLVRSSFFSTEIQDYKNFYISHVSDICITLKKFQTSTVVEGYHGSEQWRPLYEYLMAVGSVMKDRVWNNSDEKTASDFFYQFRTEYSKRIDLIDDFENDEEIVLRVVPTIWEYIDTHEDVITCNIDKLQDRGIQSTSIDSTILWDKNYYYISEALFQNMFGALEVISSTEFKRQLANAGIVEKRSNTYTDKKTAHFFDRDSRSRYIWIPKDKLLSEDNLALENLYENRALQLNDETMQLERETTCDE